MKSQKHGEKVKKGDLVKMKHDDVDPRKRKSGVVIKLGVHHPDSSDIMIQIAEVMWNCGTSWIDASRIEVMDEQRR